VWRAAPESPPWAPCHAVQTPPLGAARRPWETLATAAGTSATAAVGFRPQPLLCTGGALQSEGGARRSRGGRIAVSKCAQSLDCPESQRRYTAPPTGHHRQRGSLVLEPSMSCLQVLRREHSRGLTFSLSISTGGFGAPPAVAPAGATPPARLAQYACVRLETAALTPAQRKP
jgi:hypothetical protein